MPDQISQNEPRMPYTNRSDPKQNPWYPNHVSDRADELIKELSEAQSQCLYDELKKMTLGDWFSWLEDQREEISEYDRLTRAERKRSLNKQPNLDVLKLHHACVYVELWRARTTNAYFSFPPNGQALDTPESQREMMLSVLASYNSFEMGDLWPFACSDDADPFPFSRE